LRFGARSAAGRLDVMTLFDRKPMSRERTQQDRERARAEREARRAARDGRAPAAADPTVAPPPRRDPAPEPAPEPAPAPAPVPVPEPEPSPRFERELEPAAAAMPRRQAAPARAQPAPRQVPAARPSFIDEPVQEDWSSLDGHEVAALDGHRDGEPEAGRRWRLRRRSERPPREPRAPRASGSRRGPRRWIPLALLAALVIALAWFAISLFQPFHSQGSGAVDVRIPANSGVSAVGDVLERRGVISSSFFFGLRVRVSGHSGDLHPGLYALKRDMSYGAVIDALVKGPAAAKTVDVTIPPGRAIRQTAARLRAAHIPLRGSYLAAARRSSVLNPVSYGAPRSTPNLEGFLFPDTYQIRVGSPASDLVARQLQAFKKKFAKVDLRAAKSKNLSAYDVLIIASMIEREADLDRERPMIARVIYNRLNDFTRPLTSSDFARKSPYNTRLNKDLPPTPIGNPGLASIQAAAHPVNGKLLYYVVKPGACGEHAFSTTYAQFLKDAQRYSNARAAKGGNSPTSCR
jgi:cell division protein YceG involved in septum cleavage